MSYFAKAPANFSDAIDGGKIKIDVFLAGATVVGEMFGLLKGLSMVGNDIAGNIKKIGDCAAAGNYVYLEDMVEDEDKQGLNGGKSWSGSKKIGKGTESLLWLKRAMAFTAGIMKKLVEGETNLKTAIKAAYADSLSKVHGMIVRGTFSTAIGSFCPTYEAFMEKLGDGTDAATTLKETATFLEPLQATMTIVVDYYKTKGLETEM
eukprot:m.59883 g.59883  ORF g.59883 m.59883 type:complete len:206 (+) comp22773_c0_seq1:77-694(+)